MNGFKLFLSSSLLSFTFFFLQSCDNQTESTSTFCNQSMDFKIFENKMVVGFSQLNEDHTLSKKYACPPMGQGIFPAVEFSGIPEEATHVLIEFIDSTCSYGCNGCCQFKHCALEIPVSDLSNKEIFSTSGIKESKSPNQTLSKYLRKNSLGKKEYFPFCPPPFQTHAFYIRMTALKADGSGKKEAFAKAQSIPGLLWSPQLVNAYKKKHKM